MSDPLMSEEHLGKEPDYRFSLRTALALLAGGVLLYQYGTRIEPIGLRLGLCSGLIMMSGALSLGAYLHWRRCDHAMRHDAPLPKSFLIVLLAAAVMVLAMITAGSLVLP